MWNLLFIFPPLVSWKTIVCKSISLHIILILFWRIGSQKGLKIRENQCVRCQKKVSSALDSWFSVGHLVRGAYRGVMVTMDYAPWNNGGYDFRGFLSWPSPLLRENWNAPCKKILFTPLQLAERKYKFQC